LQATDASACLIPFYGFVAQIAGRDSRGESKMLPVLHEQTPTAEIQNYELAIL